MKISYNRLKEYIKIKESPAKIAELLTKSGSEVKAIGTAGSDSIMDIEITPNRSDCLSYVGIAREASALTGKTVKIPPFRIKKQKALPKAQFSVDIKDKDLCPRYTARLIRDVKVGGSPDWLKKKILSMGLRPVNNIVDITNFVLFELGQPMHAFDYDKIRGKSVIVRRAHDGEKLVSIDKLVRKLEKGMLIIADNERPIAIGGIMGGLDTEVTKNTKNILLESAYFDPVSVRRTSFKLALSSESSYRFERSVDPQMVLDASSRAALLIKDICGGKIDELADKGKRPERHRTISLRIEQLNKILNLQLKETYVKKVLKNLGLKPISSKDGVIKVSIPSFRRDISREIDLVEEVSRIYGYENIAVTIPKIVPNPERKSIFWKARKYAREILVSSGLNEVITYSLLSRRLLDKVFGPYPAAITIKNPLSAEQELMRPSLLPGILNVLLHNLNRGIKDLKIFEIANVYCRNLNGGYSEKINLCIALTGLATNDWHGAKRDVTFFDLKGLLEALLSRLGLKDFTVREKQVSFLAEGVSAEIYYDGKSIGKAGCLSGNIANIFDLSQKVFLAEINFDFLVPFAELDKKFGEIPKFPSIRRDISLIAGERVLFEEIISLVKKRGGEAIDRIELFDRYTGKHIPRGHHGLSFRIEYRDKKRTLTSEEVDKIHSEIRKSLIEVPGITLR